MSLSQDGVYVLKGSENLHPDDSSRLPDRLKRFSACTCVLFSFPKIDPNTHLIADMSNNQNTAFAVEDNKKLAIFAAEWLRLIAIEKENERNHKEEEIVWGSQSSLNNTTWFLGILQVLLLILFATVGGSEVIEGTVNQSEGVAAYNMFIGVEIMM